MNKQGDVKERMKCSKLVWNHQHNSVSDVLGYAVFENREDGTLGVTLRFNGKAESEDENDV